MSKLGPRDRRRGPTRSWSRLGWTCFLITTLASAPFHSGTRLAAQADEGSGEAALGGALLGAYSGTVLGLVGAMGPCNRSLSGVRCPRIAAAIGGAVGMASGIAMGLEDPDLLWDRLAGAGYGALVGGLVGGGLSQGVRQYGGLDAAAFLALGAGIGASPRGAAVGFGAGALLGVLTWIAIPEVKIGDAVALSLLGLAAGGLTDWVTGMDDPARMREPDGGRATAVFLPLQVRFR